MNLCNRMIDLSFCCRMKAGICLVLVLCIGIGEVDAQRKLPSKTKEQKALERQAKKQRVEKVPDTELRWNPRKIPDKSKGFPEISSWHTGTAGILPSDAAEISLVNPSRIGFSRKTELLFRIAEEPILPNIGLKHLWWANKRFALASEHSLYYTYPGLKILQCTGFKSLVPDSVKIEHGFAMRHEFLFSWLMNPKVWGCPDPPPERILTMRIGTESYMGRRNADVHSFDYAPLLYHTRLLDGQVLYYGGLQFDSYMGKRFHYSLNGLFYSLDLKKEYAAEANLRLTAYVSRRFGISVAAKGAYMNVGDRTRFACIPLLDLTYLVNPGRSVIQHGLYKRGKRRRN